MTRVQPRIAVVVPCYNASETLDQTLESVRQQDVPVEVVVVDDGSTDASADIARRFSPWARVIEGPNRGVSSARNRGIAETTAEWLVFLDADDLLKPETLRRRLAPALEAEADVIICEYEELIEGAGGVFTVGARRRVDWQALRRDPEGAIASHVWTTTAALAYRRSLVEKIGGFRLDLPVIQDARLLFDAAFHGARMVGTDHVGAQYRIVPHSLSRRDPAGFWRDVLVNGRQIEALWRERQTLSRERLGILRDIYDQAARGLFARGDAAFFQASASGRALGLELSLHSRVATPLARLIGIRAARRLLALSRRA
jgi:glycosyltransferase involved in cell wall biosynthesis